MKRILAYAFLASSALIATGVSGCVREEIGPTNFHTSAYIEHDAPSGDEPQDLNQCAATSGARPIRFVGRSIAPLTGATAIATNDTIMSRNLLLGLLLSLALTGAHAGCVEEQA